MTRFWKPACVALIAAIASTSLVARADAPAREFADDCFFMKADNAKQQKLDELVGKPMPALQLADWENGEVKPDDLKGKVVVIDIWATWCGPCRKAIPHTNALMKKHAKDGLVVVGVCSSKSGQDKMAAVVKSDGMKYATGKDPGEKTATAYNVGFYPTYVVIDRAGKVRAIGLTPDGVDKVVKKLLAESNVS